MCMLNLHFNQDVTIIINVYCLVSRYFIFNLLSITKPTLFIKFYT